MKQKLAKILYRLDNGMAVWWLYLKWKLEVSNRTLQ